MPIRKYDDIHLREINDICDIESEQEYKKFMITISGVLPYLPINRRSDVILELENTFNSAVRISIESAFKHGIIKGIETTISDKIG